MIINMTGGGGGAALNFKVVPGLTQPGTASENTIWVKTERIGAWYFSATQPEGMQEWDVWFPTGTESDGAFNALRKNGLQVYPLSVKQMISGSLVNKEAEIYQGGKWIYLWNGVLYDSGDEYEHITGGWVPAASGATITRDATEMKVKTTDPLNFGYVYTNKKLDLTRYSILHAIVRTGSTKEQGSLGISDNKISTSGNIKFTNNEYKEVTYNISDDDRLCYIQIGDYGTDASVFIRKVWLT